MRNLMVMAGVLALAAGAAQGQSAVDGEGIYGAFCVACHGTDGKGDGPMAEILTVEPADLTALAAGNDGKLPVARIARQIDGRDPALAHGGPMPLFGRFFEGEDVTIAAEGGQPMMTSRGIADLIAYIETLQE